jgi:hypothetical protein
MTDDPASTRRTRTTEGEPHEDGGAPIVASRNPRVEPWVNFEIQLYSFQAPLTDSRLTMNTISSILRMICGLALIILSVSTYYRNSIRITSGGSAQIFGFPTGAAGWQLTLALGVIGLIGLFLIILGIAGLRKRH